MDGQPAAYTGARAQPPVRAHTDSAPASVTISGYDTQYGAGTMTSSPGSHVARIACAMDCLAPLLRTMQSSPYSSPFSLLSLAQIRCFRLEVPVLGVYRVLPA
eukprot:scaffold207_cov409-Prasinococcus_capsulatus_cf.AAC.22